MNHERHEKVGPVNGFSHSGATGFQQVRFADFVLIAFCPTSHRCAPLHSLRALRTRQDDPSFFRILVIPESDGAEAASIGPENLFRQTWNHRWTRRGQAAGQGGEESEIEPRISRIPRIKNRKSRILIRVIREIRGQVFSSDSSVLRTPRRERRLIERINAVRSGFKNPRISPAGGCARLRSMVNFRNADDRDRADRVNVSRVGHDLTRQPFIMACDGTRGERGQCAGTLPAIGSQDSRPGSVLAEHPTG